jgi:hypothetical protein
LFFYPKISDESLVVLYEEREIVTEDSSEHDFVELKKINDENYQSLTIQGSSGSTKFQLFFQTFCPSKSGIRVAYTIV